MSFWDIVERVVLNEPPNEKRIRGIDIREPGYGLWTHYRCTGCTIGCLLETRGEEPCVCTITGTPEKWERVE